MIINDIKTTHKIIRGDSRQMNELPDNSVHLAVTSPPYWQLKDYGTDDQIGYNDSYEKYINNLNLVWQECFRVLQNGCRLCVNIGDQFARSVYYGRYKIIPIRTEIIKFCEIIGFDYMGAIIWQKSTTMNTSGGATIMGSFPYPRNGIIKLDYEFILLFKKNGIPEKIDKNLKELSKMTKEEWNTYFQGHWNFNGVRQGGHIAMFPEELPKRLIKMFSFVGDTVLDPFVGSGTTSLAAKNLCRNSVGYEINPKFIDMIKQKLNTDSGVNFIEQEKLNINFNDNISKLPYIFQDPIKLDKKIDPKKLQFGSKIDDSKTARMDFFTVKEIIDPETLKLNNNLIIKLLGVKNNPQKLNGAMSYLKNKTNKQRVFLRFDSIKYDEKNNLLCYLYLQNKTFINAHLIKTGLVNVEDNYNYKYKENLLTYFKIMPAKKIEKYSKDFGKKEKVLNYACQTYQLSRPNKVGAVMALIRECQPKTIDEWEKWYFEKALTESKNPIKITHEILTELGERLYEKITEVVIPEWQAAFAELSLQDCKDYIYNLTINRTYDGFIREKSVVNDGLAKIFPEVKFIESDNDLDHAGDIDYLGLVGEKAFGIQIKPITAKANFGNYSVSERMRANFQDFEQKYHGKVFIVFSLDGEIGNKEIVKEIEAEIKRLK